jgi:hypothetical protein
MTGRGQERSRLMRRIALGAAVLVLLALLFLISGHWLLALIFGIPAVIAVWMYTQARGVR